jgi:hypothetical protein
MTLALALVVFAVIAATSSAALPKPKPWQWKPEKVITRLTALRPINHGSLGAEMLAVRCTGQGRGVAGRFSRFTCETQWRSEGTYTSTLTVRILPVGTGKLCVVTTTNASGELVAVPFKPGTAGLPIKPALACP